MSAFIKPLLLPERSPEESEAERGSSLLCGLKGTGELGSAESRLRHLDRRRVS